MWQHGICDKSNYCLAVTDNGQVVRKRERFANYLVRNRVVRMRTCQLPPATVNKYQVTYAYPRIKVPSAQARKDSIL